ncbi:aromatic amino acid exporter [Pseudovibrio sp. Ad14]|nr:aromatic amino acid exporter [Pseudovibrio sp. W74]KZL04204.1 aromatic amino acid exporter [Pseudovibrio sp. Ad14]
MGLCCHGAAMRLFILTSIVMVAFAANSVLNRLALADGEIGPSAFASIRIVAGALMLLALIFFRGGNKLSFSKPNVTAVLALCAYILGFSHAYISLDAGFGALLLFGAVQITMFIGAFIQRENLTLQKWIGAALAFSGLIYLLSPSNAGIDPLGAGLMTIAAIGWGIYSIIGRGAANPLKETGMNFLYGVPIISLALFLFPDTTTITASGVLLAIISGAITSGLGYALWYAIIPQLQTSTAAVAQLTVPIIATAGGIVFLAEAIDSRFIIATTLVLCGVGISAYRRKPNTP